MKKIRLEDIPKKPPFRVPDKYFLELTQDIQARIAKKQWVPSGQLKWALAGSLVIALLFLIILKPSSNQLTAEDLLAQVSEQDLIDYLDMNDFTESELLEGLSEDEIDQLWMEDESLGDLDIDEEDIDELLMDYETDFDKYL